MLALLKREPFRHFEAARLVGSYISAVSLSEVLGRLRSGGPSEEQAAAACDALDLAVVPFERADAESAARLMASTRCAGLSLADRACIAPAETGGHGGPGLGKSRYGAEIVLIR